MRNNTERQRFELDIEGGPVYADYRQEDGRLIISYVYAPPELRGSGAASRLMQEIADYAQAHNKHIIPVCSYAAIWMRRHAEPSQASAASS